TATTTCPSPATGVDFSSRTTFFPPAKRAVFKRFHPLPVVLCAQPGPRPPPSGPAGGGHPYGSCGAPAGARFSVDVSCFMSRIFTGVCIFCFPPFFSLLPRFFTSFCSSFHQLNYGFRRS